MIQYWLGYSTGRWQQFRKRISLSYLRGYVAGLIERVTR